MGKEDVILQVNSGIRKFRESDEKLDYIYIDLFWSLDSEWNDLQYVMHLKT